jgi:pyruvate,water dikinase
MANSERRAPLHALLLEVERIRHESQLLALFSSNKSDQDVYAKAIQDTNFAEFFHNYLEVWGDRCVDGLKLETPPLKARPDLFVRTLRHYLDGPPIDPKRFGEIETKSRTAAEKLVQQRLGIFKHYRFMKGLRKARACAAKREGLDVLRTKLFALVGDIFRNMGEKMATAGALKKPTDIFFLNLEEVWAWVDTASASLELQAIVEARKAEFEGHQQAPPLPERFYTYGPVKRNNQFMGEHWEPQIDEEGFIRGTPCVPGVVEETVVVCHEPGDKGSLQGQILATSHIDSCWIPLFTSISGLLVEQGNLLSHSAIIAREVGLPTIIGLRGITDSLNDGEKIRINGAEGSVERLSHVNQE